MGCGPSFDAGYGYVWSDEATPAEWMEEEDIDFWIKLELESNGIVDPWPTLKAPYGSPEYEEWKREVDLDGYHNATKAVSEAQSVEFIQYGDCMSGYMSPCLVVKESKVGNYSWEPLTLSSEQIAKAASADLDTWNTQLLAFAERYGVDLSEAQGPTWFIVPSYG